MSQEKVNRYKEEKANRKQNIVKEKRKRTLNKVVGVLLAVVIVGWVEVDYTAVSDYLQSLD